MSAAPSERTREVLARSIPKHSMNYRSVVVKVVAGEPLPAPDLKPGIDVPEDVTGYHRPER